MTTLEPVPILIEFPDQYGMQPAGLSDRLAEIRAASEQALQTALETMKGMAQHITKAIGELEREARPDEMTVEFSIKLEVEGGAVVPLVAKTTAGGQFTVTYKWTFTEPGKAKVSVTAKP